MYLDESVRLEFSRDVAALIRPALGARVQEHLPRSRGLACVPGYRGLARTGRTGGRSLALTAGVLHKLPKVTLHVPAHGGVCVHHVPRVVQKLRTRLRNAHIERVTASSFTAHESMCCCTGR